MTLSSYPSAATTGVPAGKSLKKLNGNLVVTTAGTTIDGLDVLGSITVKADRVTVKNTRVRCVDVTDFCVALVGRDGKLQTTDIGGGAGGSSFTKAIGIYSGGDDGSATSTQISKVDVHHTSDGMRIDGYTTVSDSYVHELDYNDGVHSDGTTTSRGRQVVYRHNTFESGTNCTIFLQQNGGEKISGIVIDSNLLRGESRGGQQTSFGICTDTDITSVSVHANVFDRNWQVGAATQNHSWTTWAANRWSDGAPLPRP